MTIAPVTCTVETKASPERAFALFTERMGEWWPGKTIGADPHVAIIVEPRVDGRWFERSADGVETQWGKVLVWEPPRRVVFGWQLNDRFVYDPDFLTEVEISFDPLETTGTKVRLEHRNLERYGAEAERFAGLITGGWEEKLAGFRAFTSKAGGTA